MKNFIVKGLHHENSLYKQINIMHLRLAKLLDIISIFEYKYYFRKYKNKYMRRNMIKRMPNKLSALALAVLAAANTTHAQEKDTSLSGLMLEEIVVTAQKREQLASDVPVAVTALDARALQRQGINEAQDLKNIIPNFSAGEYQGEVKINIRGVGQLIQSSNPGIAIHVDGVYQPRAALAGLLQADVAGVEVLRGPQGTTYGRNANGGAVNYTTESAGDEFGGFVHVGFADYDETTIRGAFDVPVTDAVRARVMLNSWDRGEGFYENVGAGGDGGEGDSFSARFRLDADFSETLSGSLIFSHAEVEGSFGVFDSITPVPASVINRPAFQAGPFSFDNSLFGTSPRTDDLDPLQISQDQTANQDREYQSLTGILNWEINDTFSLRSITGFQSWDDFRFTENDLTNGNIVDATVREEIDTFSQELNLTFATENSSGVVGLFYLNDEAVGTQRLEFQNTILFGPGPVPGGSQVNADWNPYENNSIALFADMNYDITDRLSIIAGIRFAEEEVDLGQSSGFFANTPAGFAPPGPPGVVVPLNVCQAPALELINGGVGTPFQQPTLEYSITTPKIGLAFAATDDNNLYATYSEGFKSGGYGLRTGCGDQYDEETVASFEIGSKNTFADGRVRLNATAFMYDYEGYQIEQLQGFAFAIQNADAAEVRGVELESTIAVTDNLIALINGSYQKHEFTDYRAIDSLNPQLGEQDLSGNPLPATPDATLNVGLIYQLNNGLGFQLNASYKSEINFREFDNIEDGQESYTLVNAAITWDSEDDKFNVRFYADNLTDEEYVGFLFSSSLTSNRIGTWGAPRQIGAEVRYNF